MTSDRILWYYYDKGWCPYDAKASVLVEDQYQHFLSNPTVDVLGVKSGYWRYNIDFTAMTQTNVEHPSHTVRNIRRLLIDSSDDSSLESI